VLSAIHVAEDKPHSLI